MSAYPNMPDFDEEAAEDGLPPLSEDERVDLQKMWIAEQESAERSAADHSPPVSVDRAEPAK